MDRVWRKKSSGTLTMNQFLLIWFSFVALSAASCDTLYTPSYYECEIKNTSLPTLCCPKGCSETFAEILTKEKNEGFQCKCNVKPFWKESMLHSLEIEYVSVNGEALVSGEEYQPSKLQHTGQYLSELPSNLCQYFNLTLIDLSRNNIRYISDIRCLNNLDSLDLSYNKICMISNKTFAGLTSLRVLNIAYNRVTYVEPYSFSDSFFSVLSINLAGNQLQKIDITNVITGRPFCSIDYTNNEIKKYVNEMEWEIDPEKDYECCGGTIDLQGNALEQFFDFEKLGIPDMKMMGKIRSYGMDLRGMKWNCDCKMEPFLELYGDIVKRIWRYYYNVSCYNPQELRDISIPYLVNTSQFDRFKCEIDVTKGCPNERCHCYEQPSRDRIVVNCSALNLVDMPIFMPKGRSLELYLHDNEISTLSNREYLRRTRILDLRNNRIKDIKHNAIASLQNIKLIDLQGNLNLQDIPDNIQNVRPGIFKFGTLKINCNCGNTWYGDWIRYHELDRGENNNFLCTTPHGVKPAEDITKEFLDCRPSSKVPVIFAITLALTALLIGVIAFINKSYKYELYLLYRKYTRKEKVIDRTYDLYISCDESVDDVKIWARKHLLPSLEKDGYKVCMPERDFRAGVPYEEEIANCMRESKDVLIVLSKKETEFVWDLEWSNAWHLYKTYKILDIILINFDHLEKDSVGNNVIKAFVELNMYLDFANMNKSLIADIKSILGSPSKKFKRLQNEYLNSNVKFRQNQMLKFPNK